jgi:hypothetical protein
VGQSVADEPFAPIGHGRFGALPGGHRGGIGLDLMLAVLATTRSTGRGGGSITERHRRILWVVS